MPLWRCARLLDSGESGEQQICQQFGTDIVVGNAAPSDIGRQLGGRAGALRRGCTGECTGFYRPAGERFLSKYFFSCGLTSNLSAVSGLILRNVPRQYCPLASNFSVI